MWEDDLLSHNTFLLFDNISLAKKRYTVDELLHPRNTLGDFGGSTVLSSGRRLNKFKKLNNSDLNHASGRRRYKFETINDAKWKHRYSVEEVNKYYTPAVDARDSAALCNLNNAVFRAFIYNVQNEDRDIRLFYIYTKEYEIGYITYELISKYLNLLEIYDVVAFRYKKHPNRYIMPLNYMWYMYKTVLLLVKDIEILTNSLRGHVEKYKDAQINIWVDRDISTTTRYPIPGQKIKPKQEEEIKKIINEVINKTKHHNEVLDKEKENRIKQKKELCKYPYPVKNPAVPKRMEVKKRPEFVYGWSIEDGWQ